MILGLYSMEFQNRRLSHAHILLWLASENKLQDAKDIVEVIFAKLRHSYLYAKVSKDVATYMTVHTRYNSPCIKKGRGSKFYLKKFKLSI